LNKCFIVYFLPFVFISLAIRFDHGSAISGIVHLADRVLVAPTGVCKPHIVLGGLKNWHSSCLDSISVYKNISCFFN